MATRSSSPEARNARAKKLVRLAWPVPLLLGGCSDYLFMWMAPAWQEKMERAAQKSLATRALAGIAAQTDE